MTSLISLPDLYMHFNQCTPACCTPQKDDILEFVTWPLSALYHISAELYLLYLQKRWHPLILYLTFVFTLSYQCRAACCTSKKMPSLSSLPDLCHFIISMQSSLLYLQKYDILDLHLHFDQCTTCNSLLCLIKKSNNLDSSTWALSSF